MIIHNKEITYSHPGISYLNLINNFQVFENNILIRVLNPNS